MFEPSDDDALLLPPGQLVVQANAERKTIPFYYKPGHWESDFLGLTQMKGLPPVTARLEGLNLMELPQDDVLRLDMMVMKKTVILHEVQGSFAWQSFGQNHPDVTLELQVFYLVNPDTMRRVDDWDQLKAACAEREVTLLEDDAPPGHG